MFDAMVNLTSEMRDMNKSLTDRMDALESSLEAKIGEKFRQIAREVIEEEVKSVRTEFQNKCDSLQEQISNLERGCQDLKATYSDVTTTGSHKVNIVIKNMPKTADEDNDPKVTLHKVNSLLCDGLKLRDVRASRAIRKASHGPRS